MTRGWRRADFSRETRHARGAQREDGSTAWEGPFADTLAVPLVWDNGWLVAATSGSAIFAFRASDGQLIWHRDIGSAAYTAPTLAADRVYVPTVDARVVALRVETGAPLWEHRLPGAANEIHALDERMYLGSTDRFFYCLNTDDGREEWRWRTGGDAIGRPVVDERTVYFVSSTTCCQLPATAACSAGVRSRCGPLGPVKVGSIVVTESRRRFATTHGRGRLATCRRLAGLPRRCMCSTIRRALCRC
jgi:outer membrane protein assembly factor BamB